MVSTWIKKSGLNAHYITSARLYTFYAFQKNMNEQKSEKSQRCKSHSFG